MGRNNTPKQASNNQNLRQSFDNRKLIEGIYNNKYILVVGSEVILTHDMDADECYDEIDGCLFNANGDVNQYIINLINFKQNSDFNSFSHVYLDSKRSEGDLIFNTLHSPDWNYNPKNISTELRNLIETKLFKIVFTTTVDNHLENLMEEVWGKGNVRIVSIGDTDSLTNFQNALKNYGETEYNEPTLFYVFGNVINGSHSPRTYVETDTDAIENIAKWMKIDTYPDITKLLKEKRFMALGCKFDDWYFRFFWYILTRETKRSNTDHIYAKDNIATWFDVENEHDKNLKEYFKHLDVKIEDNVWDFMSNLHSWLTCVDNNSPLSVKIAHNKKNVGDNCIFISYKNSDFIFACELFLKLSNEKGLSNIWFDHKSLHSGDEYETIIHNTITTKTKIILTILSEDVKNDLLEKDDITEHFYIKEWHWAIENPNRGVVIIPIAYNGYNLRGKEHSIFEQITNRQPSGIDFNLKKGSSKGQNIKSGYSKLIEDLKHHLKIEQ